LRLSTKAFGNIVDAIQTPTGDLIGKITTDVAGGDVSITYALTLAWRNAVQ
jgi:hypothetical protein